MDMVEEEGVEKGELEEEEVEVDYSVSLYSTINLSCPAAMHCNRRPPG